MTTAVIKPALQHRTSLNSARVAPKGDTVLQLVHGNDNQERCYRQWFQLLTELPTHGTQQTNRHQLGISADPAKAAATSHCLKT